MNKSLWLNCLASRVPKENFLLQTTTLLFMCLVPTIDLGGTRLRVGIVDVIRRVVIVKREVPTPQYPAMFSDIVEQMLAAFGVSTGPIGFSAAPQLSVDGVVTQWPNRPHYVGHSLLARLHALRFVPTTLDDGAAAALGVHPGDNSTTLFIGLGTGVAGGAVVAGRVMPGANGAAMDIGHICVPAAARRLCVCGRLGCLQAVVSARVVAECARAAGLDPGRIADAYLAGDPAAVQIVGQLLPPVTEALAILMGIFDPDRIVLDAGFLGPTPFVEKVQALLRLTHPRSTINRPRVPGEAQLIGAAIASQNSGS